MRTLFAILSLLTLSSCSFFLPKQKVIDYSEAYITGIGTEGLTSDRIKDNLSRKSSMAGGNYQILAFPISKAYVQALAKEVIAGKNLTRKQSLRFKDNLNKKFINDKVCVDTILTIKEFERVNSLDQWRITLVDSNNIAYKLDWLKEGEFGFFPGPITSVRQSYHGKEKFWTLMGKACAVADVRMQEGFTLIFRPSFVQWPFDDEEKVEWTFDHTKVVDGKEVKVKKKERKKEGYRGW
ncbi:MAG: hypothetical protein CME70_09355 [Halobacteriovorax sp.]|nr:hypothetical protein [Halobacteriovorax sp.]|tara:strand:+ start:198371 stop:199084 length:714 start_codon:yes stop_codon:yes gene_type:complete